MTPGARWLCGALLALPGCGTQAPTAASPPPSEAVFFRDVTDESGLDFAHENGGTGRKYLPEIMGSGGSLLDYDGDGHLDVYLVQSGNLPGTDGTEPAPTNRLYRNRGDGTYQDVTDSSKAADAGYGMGSVAGDYDNDGDPDLYLANVGPDVLLANNGDGTFRDATAEAGLDNPGWASSAVFFDADNDGDLDLYVVNYLEFSVAAHVDCGTASEGVFRYCHPDVYPMAPDRFFRNQGDGTFREATLEAGLDDRTGKGLGVVAADFDGDGWDDLYVANDSTPNFLYLNRRGRFEESGVLAGVAHNEDGLTEAGMGTDAGDVNGDGRPDILVTNLSNETNALYLGGEGFFQYHTRASGLYEGSLLPVGFGTDLLDLDNDGDLDMLVANGHVIDNVELIDDAQTFRQPAQVFLNDGSGNFRLLAQRQAGDVSVPRVGRGTMTLDWDGDGRLDVLVTFNGDRARLFRNVWPEAGNWIRFRLRGVDSNRDGFGARVGVEAGGRSLEEQHRSASGYQTSSQPRLHFGLGPARAARRVTVRWPGGTVQVFEDLPAGRDYLLVEGEAPEPQPPRP